MLDFLIKLLTKIRDLRKKNSVFCDFKLIGYKNNILKFQVINKRATFSVPINSILKEFNYIYWISPKEAAYIGNKLSKINPNLKRTLSAKNNQNIHSLFLNRYGKYAISGFERFGGISFIYNKSKKNELTLDPREIAFSELINEFDSSEAFYIGLQAGYKILETQSEINDKCESEEEEKYCRKHLKLVQLNNFIKNS